MLIPEMKKQTPPASATDERIEKRLIGMKSRRPTFAVLAGSPGTSGQRTVMRIRSVRGKHTGKRIAAAYGGK
jgi:hypothetical protein